MMSLLLRIPISFVLILDVVSFILMPYFFIFLMVFLLLMLNMISLLILNSVGRPSSMKLEPSHHIKIVCALYLLFSTTFSNPCSAIVPSYPSRIKFTVTIDVWC